MMVSFSPFFAVPTELAPGTGTKSSRRNPIRRAKSALIAFATRFPESQSAAVRARRLMVHDTRMAVFFEIRSRLAISTSGWKSLGFWASLQLPLVSVDGCFLLILGVGYLLLLSPIS